MTCNIFIGYDFGEIVAYHTLVQSIIETSSIPVNIVPVALPTIKDIFTREAQLNQSTQFAFSRFLTPYLSNYEGWSIFMDCDMLVLSDIKELWELRDDRYAVMVCKHEYKTKTDIKFRGSINQDFKKKMWSSMMLMNNSKCKALTPEFVNSATGLELHQFKWLSSEDLIGSIPLVWNWLVGEYEYSSEARLVHYTLGGPYFKEYEKTEYSEDWFKVYNRLKEVKL